MVTIVQTPTQTGGAEPIPITNCVKWFIKMTGVETDKECKTMKYQLCDDAGNAISGVGNITPVDGATFPLSFENDIRDYFRVQPPGFANNNTGIHTLKINVVLKYWEVTTTKDIECIVTEGPIQQSGSFQIINSASNWFCFFDENKPLSIKPKVMEVCRNTIDYLYFCKGGLVGGVEYDENGNVVGDIGPFTVADDSYIGIGPGNKYGTDGVPSHIDCIKIYGPNKLEYYYKFCCCDGKQLDVHFQSLLGGFNTISFNESVTKTLSTSQSEICLSSSWCRKQQSIWYQNAGIRISEKSIVQKYSFSKIIEDDELDGIQEYLLDFASSCLYYIKVPLNKTNTSFTFMPFIVDPGSITISTKEGCPTIVGSGFVPVPTNKPSPGF